MKLKHNVPVGLITRTDSISEEYQREVDRATESAEVRYQSALRRLQREEQRLVAAKAKAPTKKRRAFVEELEARIEMRRLELRDLHRLMTQSSRSTTHTGTKRPHRQVPSTEVI